jgi:hypothetical protein
VNTTARRHIYTWNTLFPTSAYTMNSGFGESVSPVAAIQAILHDYPFSASILRELLQNSDDARATNQVCAAPPRRHLFIESSRFLFSTREKTLH